MGLVLQVAPTVEPIDLAAAKLQLRVDTDVTAEDALIEALIVAAREHLEERTNRAFINQDWRWTFDAFPDDDDEIVLPLVPVAADGITAFTYLDTNGVSQPFTDYVVDADDDRTRILLAYGKAWPSTLPRKAAVTIDFTAGYGTDGTKVPAALLAAMKLLVGHWFENREAVNVGNIVSEVPLAVDALIARYRRVAMELA